MVEPSLDDTIIADEPSSIPRLETAESMEDEYQVPITPRERRNSEDQQDKPGLLRQNRVAQVLSKSFV